MTNIEDKIKTLLAKLNAGNITPQQFNAQSASEIDQEIKRLVASADSNQITQQQLAAELQRIEQTRALVSKSLEETVDQMKEAESTLAKKMYELQQRDRIQALIQKGIYIEEDRIYALVNGKARVIVADLDNILMPTLSPDRNRLAFRTGCTSTTPDLFDFNQLYGVSLRDKKRCSPSSAIYVVYTDGSHLQKITGENEEKKDTTPYLLPKVTMQEGLLLLKRDVNYYNYYLIGWMDNSRLEITVSEIEPSEYGSDNINKRRYKLSIGENNKPVDREHIKHD